jgi:hypothetical protein
MAWWMWLLLAVYFVGFMVTMHFQITMSPNATLGLMALRATAWPVYWATGWPHGVPLRMD